MLIGKRIKDMRLAKGYSQQELGNLLGVTKVSICGYETGTRVPSLDTFILLANVFETSTDFLLGRECSIYSEETKEYLGSVSKDDIEIIKELKKNDKLYERIFRDKKRSVNLINKKIQ